LLDGLPEVFVGHGLALRGWSVSAGSITAAPGRVNGGPPILNSPVLAWTAHWRARMARRVHSPLRTSVEDISTAREVPDTPQTASAAYRLAFADQEFLTSEDTR